MRQSLIWNQLKLSSVVYAASGSNVRHPEWSVYGIPASAASSQLLSTAHGSAWTDEQVTQLETIYSDASSAVGAGMGMDAVGYAAGLATAPTTATTVSNGVWSEYTGVLARRVTATEPVVLHAVNWVTSASSTDAVLQRAVQLNQTSFLVASGSGDVLRTNAGLQAAIAAAGTVPNTTAVPAVLMPVTPGVAYDGRFPTSRIALYGMLCTITRTVWTLRGQPGPYLEQLAASSGSTLPYTRALPHDVSIDATGIAASSNVVIPPGTLLPGYVYTASVSITIASYALMPPETAAVLPWMATEVVTVASSTVKKAVIYVAVPPVAPASGALSVSPQNGTALFTDFRFAVSGWMSNVDAATSISGTQPTSQQVAMHLAAVLPLDTASRASLSSVANAAMPIDISGTLQAANLAMCPAASDLLASPAPPPWLISLAQIGPLTGSDVSTACASLHSGLTKVSSASFSTSSSDMQMSTQLTYSIKADSDVGSNGLLFPINLAADVRGFASRSAEIAAATSWPGRPLGPATTSSSLTAVLPQGAAQPLYAVALYVFATAADGSSAFAYAMSFVTPALPPSQLSNASAIIDLVNNATAGLDPAADPYTVITVIGDLAGLVNSTNASAAVRDDLVNKLDDAVNGIANGNGTSSSGGVVMDDSTLSSVIDALNKLTDNPSSVSNSSIDTTLSTIDKALDLVVPPATDSDSGVASDVNTGQQPLPPSVGDGVLEVLLNMMAATEHQDAVSNRNASSGASTDISGIAGQIGYGPCDVPEASSSTRSIADRVSSALSKLTAALLRGANPGDAAVDVSAGPPAAFASSDGSNPFCGPALTMTAMRVPAQPPSTGRQQPVSTIAVGRPLQPIRLGSGRRLTTLQSSPTLELDAAVAAAALSKAAISSSSVDIQVVQYGRALIPSSKGWKNARLSTTATATGGLVADPSINGSSTDISAASAEDDIVLIDLDAAGSGLATSADLDPSHGLDTRVMTVSMTSAAGTPLHSWSAASTGASSSSSQASVPKVYVTVPLKNLQGDNRTFGYMQRKYRLQCPSGADTDSAAGYLGSSMLSRYALATGAVGPNGAPIFGNFSYNSSVIISSVTTVTKTLKAAFGYLTRRADFPSYKLSVDCGGIVGVRTVTCGVGSYGRSVEYVCPRAVSQPTCAYWDTSNDAWATDGCTVVNQTAGALTCACTHLTEFAARFSLVAAPDIETFEATMRVPGISSLFGNQTAVVATVASILVAVAVAYVMGQSADRVAERRFKAVIQADEEVRFLRKLDAYAGGRLAKLRLADEDEARAFNIRERSGKKRLQRSLSMEIGSISGEDDTAAVDVPALLTEAQMVPLTPNLKILQLGLRWFLGLMFQLKPADPIEEDYHILPVIFMPLWWKRMKTRVREAVYGRSDVRVTWSGLFMVCAHRMRQCGRKGAGKAPPPPLPTLPPPPPKSRRVMIKRSQSGRIPVGKQQAADDDGKTVISYFRGVMRRILKGGAGGDPAKRKGPPRAGRAGTSSASSRASPPTKTNPYRSASAGVKRSSPGSSGGLNRPAPAHEEQQSQKSMGHRIGSAAVKAVMAPAALVALPFAFIWAIRKRATSALQRGAVRRAEMALSLHASSGDRDLQAAAMRGAGLDNDLDLVEPDEDGEDEEVSAVDETSAALDIQPMAMSFNASLIPKAPSVDDRPEGMSEEEYREYIASMEEMVARLTSSARRTHSQSASGFASVRDTLGVDMHMSMNPAMRPPMSAFQTIPEVPNSPDTYGDSLLGDGVNDGVATHLPFASPSSDMSKPLAASDSHNMDPATVAARFSQTSSGEADPAGYVPSRVEDSMSGGPATMLAFSPPPQLHRGGSPLPDGSQRQRGSPAGPRSPMSTGGACALPPPVEVDAVGSPIRIAVNPLMKMKVVRALTDTDLIVGSAGLDVASDLDNLLVTEPGRRPAVSIRNPLMSLALSARKERLTTTTRMQSSSFSSSNSESGTSALGPMPAGRSVSIGALNVVPDQRRDEAASFGPSSARAHSATRSRQASTSSLGGFAGVIATSPVGSPDSPSQSPYYSPPDKVLSFGGSPRDDGEGGVTRLGFGPSPVKDSGHGGFVASPPSAGGMASPGGVVVDRPAAVRRQSTFNRTPGATLVSRPKSMLIMKPPSGPKPPVPAFTAVMDVADAATPAPMLASAAVPPPAAPPAVAVKLPAGPLTVYNPLPDYDKLLKDELKAECEKRGLETTSHRPEMRARLRAYDAAAYAAAGLPPPAALGAPSASSAISPGGAEAGTPAVGVTGMQPDTYDQMKGEALRDECVKRGLDPEGKRESLRARLREHDRSMAKRATLDLYDGQTGEALRAECAARGLPSEGSIDEVRAALRQHDAANAAVDAAAAVAALVDASPAVAVDGALAPQALLAPPTALLPQLPTPDAAIGTNAGVAVVAGSVADATALPPALAIGLPPPPTDPAAASRSNSNAPPVKLPPMMPPGAPRPPRAPIAPPSILPGGLILPPPTPSPSSPVKTPSFFAPGGSGTPGGPPTDNVPGGSGPLSSAPPKPSLTQQTSSPVIMANPMSKSGGTGGFGASAGVSGLKVSPSGHRLIPVGLPAHHTIVPPQFGAWLSRRLARPAPKTMQAQLYKHILSAFGMLAVTDLALVVRVEGLPSSLRSSPQPSPTKGSEDESEQSGVAFDADGNQVRVNPLGAAFGEKRGHGADGATETASNPAAIGAHDQASLKKKNPLSSLSPDQAKKPKDFCSRVRAGCASRHDDGDPAARKLSPYCAVRTWQLRRLMLSVWWSRLAFKDLYTSIASAYDPNLPRGPRTLATALTIVASMVMTIFIYALGHLSSKGTFLSMTAPEVVFVSIIVAACQQPIAWVARAVARKAGAAEFARKHPVLRSELVRRTIAQTRLLTMSNAGLLAEIELLEAARAGNPLTYTPTVLPALAGRESSLAAYMATAARSGLVKQSTVEQASAMARRQNASATQAAAAASNAAAKTKDAAGNDVVRNPLQMSPQRLGSRKSSDPPAPHVQGSRKSSDPPAPFARTHTASAAAGKSKAGAKLDFDDLDAGMVEDADPERAAAPRFTLQPEDYETFQYGWSDPPQSCSDNCNIIVRMCGRHPRQRTQYILKMRELEHARVRQLRQNLLRQVGNARVARTDAGQGTGVGARAPSAAVAGGAGAVISGNPLRVALGGHSTAITIQQSPPITASHGAAALARPGIPGSYSPSSVSTTPSQTYDDPITHAFGTPQDRIMTLLGAGFMGAWIQAGIAHMLSCFRPCTLLFSNWRARACPGLKVPADLSGRLSAVTYSWTGFSPTSLVVHLGLTGALCWCLYVVLYFGVSQPHNVAMSFTASWFLSQAFTIAVFQPVIALLVVIWQYAVVPTWMRSLAWMPTIGLWLRRSYGDAEIASQGVGESTVLTGRLTNLAMVQATGYAALLPPETAILAFAEPAAVSAAIAQASLAKARGRRSATNDSVESEAAARRRKLLLRRYVLGLVTSASLQRALRDAER